MLFLVLFDKNQQNNNGAPRLSVAAKYEYIWSYLTEFHLINLLTFYRYEIMTVLTDTQGVLAVSGMVC